MRVEATGAAVAVEVQEAARAVVKDLAKAVEKAAESLAEDAVD